MPVIVGTVREPLQVRALENVLDLDVLNVRSRFPQPATKVTSTSASTLAPYLAFYRAALVEIINAQDHVQLQTRISDAFQLPDISDINQEALFTSRNIDIITRSIFHAVNDAARPSSPAVPTLSIGSIPAFELMLENDGDSALAVSLTVLVSGRPRPLTIRMLQRNGVSDDALRAPLPRVDASGIPPTNAKKVFHQLVHRFFSAVIANGDNKPTVTSLLFHLYFSLMYNIRLLCDLDRSVERSVIVPHDSSISPPVDFDLARSQIFDFLSSNPDFSEPLLAQLLFLAHRSFCVARFGDSYASLTLSDLSAREYVLPSLWLNIATSWGSVQAHALDTVMPNALLGPVLPASRLVRVDASGLTNGNVNVDPTHWQPLQIPSGTLLDPETSLPLVDPAVPSTYKVQRYLGATWGVVHGFTVNPSVGDVLALHDRVSTQWSDPSKSTDLSREMASLLSVYGSLGDREMAIAELFAGSGALNLPPPGFMFVVALELSQKYAQSVWGDIDMCGALAISVFDASVAAWYYKSEFMQARPVTLIRHFLHDTPIRSWAPGRGVVDMTGASWLPYQSLTFVTPPFPDVMSGHSTFSAAAGGVLRWWFNSDTLYDGFTVVSVPDCRMIANNLSVAIKTHVIGEYCIEPGSSDVEPGVSPHSTQILRYPTISSLVADAGRSRVYGGIHTNETNELSLELGADIATRVTRSIADLGIRSPYRL